MSKLNIAIINIQTTMDIFTKKSGRNTMGTRGYDYFTETDLYNALKPLMKDNGIGYTIETTGEPKFVPSGNMITFYSTGILTLFKEEEEKKLNIVLAATNTDPAKAIGSALTYGARYWLCKEFGIATNELDPDNDENTKKVNESTKLIKAVDQVSKSRQVKAQDQILHSGEFAFPTEDNKSTLIQRLKALVVSVENGNDKLKMLLGVEPEDKIRSSALLSLDEKDLNLLIERMEH